jgi:hypothetical protein
MKYACEFGNEAGERRSIVVDLENHEAEHVAGLSRGGGDSDLIGQALALRHAYRKAEPGFLHIAGKVRLLQ